MKKFLLIAALATSALAPAANAATIDTTQAFTGAWSPFGVSDTSTYGQTFTAGAANTLNSFSLFLHGAVPSPIEFKAYIYAWNGDFATGPQLFASALQTFTGSPFATPAEFAFNTGNLGLTSGQQYVAFLTTAGLQAGRPDSTATMPYAGAFGSEALAGGSFVFYNSGNNFAALTSTPWDLRNSNSNGIGDVWFRASFGNGVPEPAAWAMMLAGFGLVGSAMRRREKVAVTFA